ncbi:recombinase family protein [Arthrobacter sp. CJ23]|uniref:recombinase family protein n=1 Tax=Arthrobacter sp. CJ23 TaxID=2972479 RepID=UPI00215C45FC|nr:recombinase family protein [Arthrobacter sp. CJ23]UVJ37973.1 recombinase family protein [Arthrobacter sp. CJ23]
MTKSALYLRISKDKTGEALAVDRQEKLIRAMLKGKGWEAGPVYTDNSVSATSARAKRPAYDQMLADWEAGEFDAISSYDLDRLYRHPTQLEHLIELAESRGLFLATCAGDADLSTDNGRLFARIKASVAKAETERRSARQKAAFAQSRDAGKPHWSKRPFGFQMDGKHVKQEAEAVKTVAGMLLEGQSMADCVRWMNEQGITSTLDKPWQNTTLHRVMTSPRIAGLRVYKGEEMDGNWPEIIKPETWRGVCAILKDPKRAVTKLNSRETLLSGLLTCSVCLGKCYGTRVTKASGKRKEMWSYRCTNSAHVAKTMKRTDDHVILKTLAALAFMDTGEVEADKQELEGLRAARATEVQEWAQWQEEAAEEGLRPSEYRKPREKHEARLAEIDGKLTELQTVSLVRVATEDEAAEGIELVFQWDEMSLAKRRRIIQSVWKSITLVKTAKGVRWNPEHVALESRTA